jgi:hypothetical protein
VNAYERLLAEAIPTRPEPADPRPTWTPTQQAAHQTALLEALDGWHWQDDPRHLRLIRQPDAA